ncbi:Spy/CpxP family protein refolding chaperone [Endothiovibrio diazotrophicus]
MKTATKITLATLAALGIGVAASVQAFGPGYGGGPGYGRGGCPNAGSGMGPGAGYGRFNQDPAARVDARLARVEPLLNLTDEQKPAWEAFKTALKGRAEQRQAHRQQMQALRTSSSLTDRTDQHVALMTARLEEMKVFAAEAKKLDAVLTDEQRAVLAQYGPGAGRGFGGGPRQGMGPGAGYGRGGGMGQGPYGW